MNEVSAKEITRFQQKVEILAEFRQRIWQSFIKGYGAASTRIFVEFWQGRIELSRASTKDMTKFWQGIWQSFGKDMTHLYQGLWQSFDKDANN